ncbi:helix-turn-helix domain-containing protein [Streptomyces sp. NPDC126499]|uniref:helix-turn-helix domain-containing protein n=1 Tax=Streptomyces sp. NPDC126499 TaxID=3155314 RepID=UPI003325B2FB
MASTHPSARRRASGLIHRNVRHTTGYTVVGNHLARHRELSLVARGLALYLQSLTAGAPVGIKDIAAVVPESELRVAKAMRELEAHGYLVRYRERLPNGRIMHRTVSYNRPVDESGPPEVTPPDDTPPGEMPPDGGRLDDTPPDDTPPPPPPKRPQHPQHAPRPQRPQRPAPPSPQPPQPPQPPRPASSAPPSPPPPASPPPLAERHRPAAAVLASLHRHEPRLLLSERDILRLAPELTTWLERGARPDAVLRTLAACLPDDLVHPAGLLAHRLRVLLPPPLPARPPTPDPLQTCDSCDRAFRSPHPGRCRDCRPAEREAA